MSAALQYFEENLPHRPYHTDDLAFGLRISGKGRALLARYIQQNQPHAQFWLVFDVDREGAAIDWSDRNASTRSQGREGQFVRKSVGQREKKRRCSVDC